MADDNKSCHCEFVPQDLTPGLKVTIRAIWYELQFVFIRKSFCLFDLHSLLFSLFICCLLCSESCFLFTFLFVLTPGSVVTISYWVRAVSLTSVSFIVFCFTMFCCVYLKPPLLRHSSSYYYCQFSFLCQCLPCTPVSSSLVMYLKLSVSASDQTSSRVRVKIVVYL